MIKISREQLDFLIEKKHLKMEKGRYPELKVTCREKKSSRKKYYVPEPYKRFLKKLKNKNVKLTKN